METQSIVPQKDVQEMETAGSRLVREAKLFRVDTSLPIEERKVQLGKVADFYKDLKDVQKDREKKRKSFTAPLNLSLKNINGTYKEQDVPITEALTISGAEIKRVQKFEQALVDEENKRIKLENEANARAAAEANRIAEKHAEPGKLPTPVFIPKQAEKVAPKAVNSRKKWSFEILANADTDETDKLLLEYLDQSGKWANLLEMAIREKIRETEDPATIKIEGVRVFLDPMGTLVSR